MLTFKKIFLISLISAMIVEYFFHPLLFNITPSVPYGFYFAMQNKNISDGDYINFYLTKNKEFLLKKYNHSSTMMF